MMTDGPGPGGLQVLTAQIGAYDFALQAMEAVDTWPEFEQARAAIRKRMDEARVQRQELEASLARHRAAS